MTGVNYGACKETGRGNVLGAAPKLREEDMRSVLQKISVEGGKRRRALRELLCEKGIPYKERWCLDYYFEVINYEVYLDEFARDSEERPLYLFAHYDADKGSTGANDNGSSVAILVKLAEEIMRNGSLIPVRIIFLDAEERDCIGAEFFSREYRNKFKEVLLDGINLDCCGYGDNVVMFTEFIKGATILEDLASNSSYLTTTLKAPYCDSFVLHHFSRRAFRIMTMSVFPEQDTAALPDRLEYEEIRKSMHGEVNDDISFINYSAMLRVFSLLWETIN